MKFSILSTYIRDTYIVWDSAKSEKKIRESHSQGPGARAQVSCCHIQHGPQRSVRMPHSNLTFHVPMKLYLKKFKGRRRRKRRIQLSGCLICARRSREFTIFFRTPNSVCACPSHFGSRIRGPHTRCLNI